MQSFITLCLGSIVRVISEPCYKWTILQKNYRKMTIVKFHGKKIWEPHHDYPNLCYSKVRCKGDAPYFLFFFLNSKGSLVGTEKIHLGERSFLSMFING